MTAAAENPVLALPEFGITPLAEVDTTVAVLGSKSYTNRFLAIAGLSSEPTTLHNALLSQDTILLAEALQAFDHVEVTLLDDLLSKPYVDMTVAAMKAAGASVDRRGYEWFSIAAGQRYQGGDITVRSTFGCPQPPVIATCPGRR